MPSRERARASGDAASRTRGGRDETRARESELFLSFVCVWVICGRALKTISTTAKLNVSPN